MSRIMKSVLPLLVMLLALPLAGRAESVTVDLIAGPDSVSGGVRVNTFMRNSDFCAGARGIYLEDDYSLGVFTAGLQERFFDPALTLGLGLEGVAGEAEKYNRDFDVSAVGFAAWAAYDLARSPSQLPLLVFTRLAVAPDPMSFQDAEEYLRYSAGVKLHLLENGALLAKYTRVAFDLEKSGLDTDKHEDLFLIGLSFSFDGF